MPGSTLPIMTAEDHAAALEEIAAFTSLAHGPEPAARLAALKMRVRVFEAGAYGKLREDLTDIDCWLRARHPDWCGDFHASVAPGPYPRHLAHLTLSEQDADDVRPQLWNDLLRALAAFGYNPDGPEPARSWRVVRPSSLARLSAHRRLEGVARVEAALMKPT